MVSWMVVLLHIRVVHILIQRLTVLLSFVLVVVFHSWRETWGLYIKLGFRHFCILTNSLFTDYLII